MLKHILDNILQLSNTSLILEVVYYSVILIALSVSAVLFYKHLLCLGYDKKKTLRFILMSLILSYPLGIVSARMVGIFYFPSQFWSIDFFINQILYGKHVTFHAAIILPIIMIFCFTIIMKFKIGEVWDAFFIYMPLGHAIGRVACLLVGCCWGRSVSLSFLGQTYTFDNPVPLYSICCNIIIFFLLKGLFNWIYSREENRKYSGLVVSLYLVLYGNVRLLLELLRTTKVVFMGLTQAQIVMIVFIIWGSLVFLFIMSKSLLLRIDRRGRKEKKIFLFSLFGLFTYFLVIGLLYWFLSSNHIINWPFHKVHSITEAYQTILEYLPIFVVALLSMIWLLPSGLPVLQYFTWRTYSFGSFAIGIVMSMGYIIYMLHRVKFGIHIPSVWPPVFILSLLNSVAEEIVFRIVLYGLLQKIMKSDLSTNIIQGLVYAAIHLFIGGNLLAFQALILGLLLGWIRNKNKSVIPCIIIHFFADLGAIGYPILAS
jgi:phosphatidylglycerol---prolipoprotein diacylglyceryl transferase